MEEKPKRVVMYIDESTWHDTRFYCIKHHSNPSRLIGELLLELLEGKREGSGISRRPYDQSNTPTVYANIRLDHQLYQAILNKYKNKENQLEKRGELSFSWLVESLLRDYLQTNG